ncbi:hypothetical protein GGI35DRAFT_462329 [Trichoderma velutinum]
MQISREIEHKNMPSDQPEPSRRRRVRIHAASAARRRRSVSQQSPLPPLSATDFIVSSSSSSDSNASISPSPGSRGSATSRTRRLPPIVASQVPSPATVEAELVSYWPAVRQYINNRGHGASLGRIKVECPLCYDELPVRGLEPNSELLQHEGGVVIGCGHIFCRSCLAKWFRGPHQWTCPVCRIKMECQRCKVEARCVAIPKEHDDSEQVPLTKSELSGGEMPSICVRCEARHWWIWKVEHGRHGLPSRDVIESDFQRLMYHMMDRMEDDGVAMGMVEMEQQLLVLFKEHFMRLLEEREQHISRYVRNHLLSSTNHPWL